MKGKSESTKCKCTVSRDRLKVCDSREKQSRFTCMCVHTGQHRPCRTWTEAQVKGISTLKTKGWIRKDPVNQALKEGRRAIRARVRRDATPKNEARRGKWERRELSRDLWERPEMRWCFGELVLSANLRASCKGLALQMRHGLSSAIFGTPEKVNVTYLVRDQKGVVTGVLKKKRKRAGKKWWAERT